MGETFQFIDIVFFAMIAAFLVLRLRSVLGKRTGTERRRDTFTPPPAQAPAGREDGDNVVALPERKHAEEEPEEAAVTPEDGVAAIRRADSNFAERPFLDGARAAFDMTVKAFAAGDRAALRPILSDEVYDNFNRAIEGRERAGQTKETQVLSVDSAEIIEARMDGKNAVVTVRFVSDQMHTVRDRGGNTVAEESGEDRGVVDLWTFARNTRSPDPNWTLVETATPH